jgi:CheY-like chemotaxis protein
MVAMARLHARQVPPEPARPVVAGEHGGPGAGWGRALRPGPPAFDRAANPPPPPAQRVLVVDDDPALQALLAEVLVGAGYGLLQTTNGRDGLRLAREHRPSLVLLDLGLPGLPGHEVLRSLRADPATRAIPVIVLSATTEALLPHEARAAAQVLRKPFDVDDLLGRIRREVGAGEPALVA